MSVCVCVCHNFVWLGLFLCTLIPYLGSMGGFFVGFFNAFIIIRTPAVLSHIFCNFVVFVSAPVQRS